MTFDENSDIGKFKVVDIFVSCKYQILRHLIGITFLYLMFFSLKLPEEYNPLDLCFSIIITLGVLYTNLYILLPAFLYKQKYLYYIGLILLLLISSFYAFKLYDYFTEVSSLDEKTEKPAFLIQLIIYIVILAPFIFVSTSIKIFQKWIEYNDRFKELEKNKIEMELKALRNQINPHFIFNTLNNLNYMILKDQAKASIMLFQLSDFLSHHLHESNNKNVSLASEIKFIKDYLNLEVVRRDGFTFKVIVPKGDFAKIEVPTNIFSVFIENAIKHSLDSNEESSINVSFNINKSDDVLTFTCINTKALNTEEKINHGVGLKNVKRRLELIYPNSYELTITDLERIYKIELTFPI